MNAVFKFLDYGFYLFEKLFKLLAERFIFREINSKSGYLSNLLAYWFVFISAKALKPLFYLVIGVLCLLGGAFVRVWSNSEAALPPEKKPISDD